MLLEVVSLNLKGLLGDHVGAPEWRRETGLRALLAGGDLPDTYREILVNLERLTEEEYQRQVHG